MFQLSSVYAGALKKSNANGAVAVLATQGQAGKEKKLPSSIYLYRFPSGAMLQIKGVYSCLKIQIKGVYLPTGLEVDSSTSKRSLAGSAHFLLQLRTSS